MCYHSRGCYNVIGLAANFICQFVISRSKVSWRYSPTCPHFHFSSAACHSPCCRQMSLMSSECHKWWKLPSCENPGLYPNLCPMNLGNLGYFQLCHSQHPEGLSKQCWESLCKWKFKVVNWTGGSLWQESNLLRLESEWDKVSTRTAWKLVLCLCRSEWHRYYLWASLSYLELQDWTLTA